MQTVDFTKYLKEQFNITDLYPNRLLDEKDNTGVFVYSSEQDVYNELQGMIKYQFLTAASSKEEAERMSCHILQKVKTLKNGFALSDSYIQGIVVHNMMPIYIGRDETKRYLFSFNIEVFIQQ